MKNVNLKWVAIAAMTGTATLWAYLSCFDSSPPEEDSSTIPTTQEEAKYDVPQEVASDPLKLESEDEIEIVVSPRLLDPNGTYVDF